MITLEPGTKVTYYRWNNFKEQPTEGTIMEKDIHTQPPMYRIVVGDPKEVLPKHGVAFFTEWVREELLTINYKYYRTKNLDILIPQ